MGTLKQCNEMTLKEKYYNWLYQILVGNRKIKILPVDFKKSWWLVVLEQKFSFAYVFFVQIVVDVFYTLLPIGIIYFVSKVDYKSIFLLLGGYLFIIFLEFTLWFVNTIFMNQLVHSIRYRANLYFLTVDPIHHFTRSSGEILSKIDRDSSAFEIFLNYILYSFIPIISQTLTIVITLSIFDFRIGLAVFVFLVGLMSFSGFLTVQQSTVFEPKMIKYSDDYKSFTVQNLNQIQLIRSSFATHEISKKMNNKTNDFIKFNIVSWSSYTVIYLVMMSISILCILSATLLGINAVQNGANAAVIGGLIISFYNATRGIDEFGRKIQAFSESYIHIQDLFSFIRGFGNKTYPVLEDDEIDIK
jgi:ABC-type multidrug transport system fused ATPase/permease subunit